MDRSDFTKVLYAELIRSGLYDPRRGKWYKYVPFADERNFPVARHIELSEKEFKHEMPPLVASRVASRYFNVDLPRSYFVTKD